MNAQELRRLFADQQRRDEYVTESLRRVLHNQAALFRRIDELEKCFVKELDDIKSADDAQTAQLTKLTTAVTDATAKINTLAGQIISADDLATAKAIAQDIIDHNQKISDAADALESAANPTTTGDTSGT
jgi:hypothetical protein